MTDRIKPGMSYTQAAQELAKSFLGSPQWPDVTVNLALSALYFFFSPVFGGNHNHAKVNAYGTCLQQVDIFDDTRYVLCALYRACGRDGTHMAAVLLALHKNKINMRDFLRFIDNPKDVDKQPEKIADMMPVIEEVRREYPHLF